MFKILILLGGLVATFMGSGGLYMWGYNAAVYDADVKSLRVVVEKMKNDRVQTEQDKMQLQYLEQTVTDFKAKHREGDNLVCWNDDDVRLLNNFRNHAR